MKRIIIISLALLTISLTLIMWMQKYPQQNLAERLSGSKNFIAYNKLLNEDFKSIISNLHHKKDSIKKERTNIIFDYSFQEKDSLPLVAIPDHKAILKRNFQESFIYFKKINNEFPELRKLSRKSRTEIFRKARQILNESKKG